MGEPEIAATATRVAAHDAGVVLARTAMTVAQLVALAPLSIPWGEEIVVAPTASADGSGETPEVALDTMDG
jgi:hypothetical protein